MFRLNLIFVLIGKQKFFVILLTHTLTHTHTHTHTRETEREGTAWVVGVPEQGTKREIGLTKSLSCFVGKFSKRSSYFGKSCQTTFGVNS